MLKLFTAFGLLATCALLTADDHPVPDPPIPISVRDVQPLQTPNSPTMNAIHCSPDGDLAVQTAAGWNDNLLYIEAIGGKTHRLVFHDPRLAHTGLRDFFPLGDGRVAALFAGQERSGAPLRVLLAFWDADGTLSRVRPLDTTLYPLQFVVFPSTGNILLAGETWDDTPIGRAGMVLLDANGQFLRSVDLHDGYKPPKIPVLASDSHEKLSDAQRDAITKHEQAIAFSVMVLDDDGNAIFRRGDSDAALYFISSAGEVVRKVKPPHPPKGAVFTGFRAAHGRLLWHYAMPEREGSTESGFTWASIYMVEADAETGDLIHAYTASDHKLLGSLGCYVPGEVSFLGATADGKMQLVTADLR